MSQKYSLLMNSLNLPRFETIDELSDLIGLSSRLLYCLSKKTANYYKHGRIPKRDGSYRVLFIPSYTLHIVQCWILKKILNKIFPSSRAMAFRKGKQYGAKQNAFCHSHTLYGLSIDIKDFFPSITSSQVFTLFFNIGYSNTAATILTNLCTLNGKLPQGSACSPAISNIVCISLDRRLIGLCDKRGIRFTRYADDMYFSCDDKSLLLKYYPVIKIIIEDEGFVLNDRKTHFHTPSNRKRITGVTVACHKENMVELKAPKELKKKVRAEIFRCIITGDYKKSPHILGEISYIDFVEKENQCKYLPRIKDYISSLTDQILYFPELVSAYNENRLFKDLPLIEPINPQYIVEDEEAYEYLNYLFERRMKYININNLPDICQYSNWPETITEQEELEIDPNALPF